jgi:hypothetical protein
MAATPPQEVTIRQMLTSRQTFPQHRLNVWTLQRGTTLLRKSGKCYRRCLTLEEHLQWCPCLMVSTRLGATMDRNTWTQLRNTVWWPINGLKWSQWTQPGVLSRLWQALTASLSTYWEVIMGRHWTWLNGTRFWQIRGSTCLQCSRRDSCTSPLIL